MKFFSAMCAIWLLTCPVSGEDTAVIPRDSTASSFIPLLPDSLGRDGLRYYIYPEEKPYFQYEMGILKSPDPYHVELNPGGIFTVDPAVDLEMIYPLESRHKILLQKNDMDTLSRKPKLPFYWHPYEKKKQGGQKEKQ